MNMTRLDIMLFLQFYSSSHKLPLSFNLKMESIEHNLLIEIVYSFDGSLNGDDGIKGESDLLSNCWKWCLVGSLLTVVKKKDVCHLISCLIE